MGAGFVNNTIDRDAGIRIHAGESFRGQPERLLDTDNKVRHFLDTPVPCPCALLPAALIEKNRQFKGT
jgi:hypothetical protein